MRLIVTMSRPKRPAAPDHAAAPCELLHPYTLLSPKMR